MRKLVVYPPIESERLVLVAEAAQDLQVVNAATEAEALEAIVDAEGFFGKLTPTLLARAERLTWVQAPTASLEHYLFPELIAHPCTLTNMRGLFYDVIADHVFGFILCFARNLHVYLRQQWRHEWRPVGGPIESPFVLGPALVTAQDRAHLHLADATLGVVGLGSIGAEVARRGRAFGMRVVAVDPVSKPAPDQVTLWPMDHFERLLSESDFVVIAAPHTPQTAGLFRLRQFELMKRTGYLINIGRGVIVSLDDLVTALRSGLIAGAALDVFETEPLPPDHPLWDCGTAILTPHVAACSVRIAERHLATLLDNVRRFAQGTPLLNCVDKQNWF